MSYITNISTDSNNYYNALELLNVVGIKTIVSIYCSRGKGYDIVKSSKILYVS